nr:peptidoglycan-binding domain-containing protein [Saccharopolyspora spinosa]
MDPGTRGEGAGRGCTADLPGRHGPEATGFGDRMTPAVREFQAGAGIAATGTIDEHTWRRLLN